jgi:hypothetical protein
MLHLVMCCLDARTHMSALGLPTRPEQPCRAQPRMHNQSRERACGKFIAYDLGSPGRGRCSLGARTAHRRVCRRPAAADGGDSSVAQPCLQLNASGALLRDIRCPLQRSVPIQAHLAQILLAEQQRLGTVPYSRTVQLSYHLMLQAKLQVTGLPISRVGQFTGHHPLFLFRHSTSVCLTDFCDGHKPCSIYHQDAFPTKACKHSKTQLSKW